MARPLTGTHSVGQSLSFSVSLFPLGQDVRSCFVSILSCGWYKGGMGSRVQMGSGSFLWAQDTGTGPGCRGTRGGQYLWMEHFLQRLGMLWPWERDIPA